MTVFFSSHQIAEVDQIADRVAIVDHGRVVVSGALDDLRERYCRIQLVFEGDAPAAAFRAPGVARVRRAGRVLTVLSSAGSAAIVEEARALAPASVDVTPVTLKEIFLETVDADARNARVGSPRGEAPRIGRRTDMRQLWYKAWLETRSRFLIGLALLICSAAASVLTYPTVQKLLATMPPLDLDGEIGRKVREATILAGTFRGYIWSHVFGQNLIQMWTIFAVILGTGGLLSQMSGGGGAVHAVAAGVAP